MAFHKRSIALIDFMLV